jgi:hypothetical protein
MNNLAVDDDAVGDAGDFRASGEGGHQAVNGGEGAGELGRVTGGEDCRSANGESLRRR